MFALGIAGVTLVHLSMTFLISAPSNTVSQRYSTTIDAWIYPWFDQNWRLFAPNPMSENITIEARVSAACGNQVTRWYDLTAMDDQAILHNPFPGHTEQNLLRRAWTDGYLQTHGPKDEPTGSRAEMMRQYLVDIATDRIKPLSGRDGLPPASMAEIEFRVTTQLIAPAATPGEPAAPEVRIVGWRQLSPTTVSYGCGKGGTP